MYAGRGYSKLHVDTPINTLRLRPLGGTSLLFTQAGPTAPAMKRTAPRLTVTNRRAVDTDFIHDDRGACSLTTAFLTTRNVQSFYILSPPVSKSNTWSLHTSQQTLTTPPSPSSLSAPTPASSFTYPMSFPYHHRFFDGQKCDTYFPAGTNRDNLFSLHTSFGFLTPFPIFVLYTIIANVGGEHCFITHLIGGGVVSAL